MWENYITQLGNPALRIEILNSIPGLSFDSANNNKILGDFDGVNIPFINISDFILNKRATGRAKDLGDIDSLENL